MLKYDSGEVNFSGAEVGDEFYYVHRHRFLGFPESVAQYTVSAVNDQEVIMALKHVHADVGAHRVETELRCSRDYVAIDSYVDLADVGSAIAEIQLDKKRLKMRDYINENYMYVPEDLCDKVLKLAENQQKDNVHTARSRMGARNRF